MTMPHCKQPSIGPTSQKVDERKSPVNTQNAPMVASSTPVSKLKPVASAVLKQELKFNSDHGNQPEAEDVVEEIVEDLIFSNVDDEGT